MEKQRYYLDARANICYNKDGISYPIKIATDLQALVMAHAISADPKWEHMFGWDNQPDVLTFSATEDEVRTLESVKLDDGQDMSEYIFVRTIWPHYRKKITYSLETNRVKVTPPELIHVICEWHGYDKVRSMDTFEGEGPDGYAVFRYRGLLLSIRPQENERNQHGLQVIRITPNVLTPTQVKALFGVND